MKKTIIISGLIIVLFSGLLFLIYIKGDKGLDANNIPVKENGKIEDTKENDENQKNGDSSENATGTPLSYMELDSDNDGIPDYIEIELGLDPYNPDTDGDLVSDTQELIDNTNPKDKSSFTPEHRDESLGIYLEEKQIKNDGPPAFIPPQDSDNDGLSDEKEILLGTDPYNPDTDGDGIWDNAEITTFKTDPLNPDTDNDGFSDGEEIMTGYDPLVPNTTIDKNEPPPGSAGSGL